MATAPVAAGPQSVKPRREMGEELKAPEQFQFTKVGQSVQGVLVSIEPTLVKGKEALEYLFQTDQGTRFTCLGTSDLNKKLHPGLVGYFIDIRYERDDASFQKPGQSAMKILKVVPAKQKEPGF